jgi:hypothetical protein
MQTSPNSGTVFGVVIGLRILRLLVEAGNRESLIVQSRRAIEQRTPPHALALAEAIGVLQAALDLPTDKIGFRDQLISSLLLPSLP